MLLVIFSLQRTCYLECRQYRVTSTELQSNTMNLKHLKKLVKKNRHLPLVSAVNLAWCRGSAWEGPWTLDSSQFPQECLCWPL